SSTFVPVLSVWLLRGHEQAAVHRRERGLLFRTFGGFLGLTTRLRWLVVPAYLGLAGVAVYFATRQIGTEIFPQVDAGQFQVRLKAPTGTRIEQTEALVKEALDYVKREVGEENVAITLGYIGVVPSSYPINSVYLWTGGPEEAVVRVSLKRGVVRI